MLKNSGLFWFEVPCAEGRRKLLCYLTVLNRIRLDGDTIIAGIEGILTNLHEQLKVFLLREVDICLS